MTPDPDTTYFVPETFRFLRELALHNNREWFEANKARYVGCIQEPAVRFIRAVGPRLAGISPHIEADARPFGGSLARIYRDVRFSKDKSPYRTRIGIHFSYDRPAKGENLPGFFLHIGPGDCFVASGIWHPSPPHLAKIRNTIIGHPAAWQKVLGAGIEIGGESLVRVPSGYDPDHRFATDLRRKDFYASRPLSDRTVTSAGFADEFEAACRTLDPLNQFLARALDIPW